MAAADQIAKFLAGKDLEGHLSDPLLRSGVERQLEIIRKALAQLTRRDPDTAGTVPEVGRIIAFRNILIHGYATVDDRVVWGVVETNLIPLRAALRALLGEA